MYWQAFWKPVRGLVNFDLLEPLRWELLIRNIKLEISINRSHGTKNLNLKLNFDPQI